MEGVFLSQSKLERVGLLVDAGDLATSLPLSKDDTVKCCDSVESTSPLSKDAVVKCCDSAGSVWRINE